MKLIGIILRIANYIIGFAGVFLALGTVGGLENDQITFGQFFLYELLAIGLILLTFVVYNFRYWFNYTYIEPIRK